jgi:hypothetical protein
MKTDVKREGPIWVLEWIPVGIRSVISSTVC